jgi:hypothetical protein
LVGAGGGQLALAEGAKGERVAARVSRAAPVAGGVGGHATRWQHRRERFFTLGIRPLIHTGRALLADAGGGAGNETPRG